MRFVDLRLQLCLGLTLVAAGGCSAPHKLISARHTACPVRELEIRQLVSAPDREDWIAVCGERSFACSTREKGRRLVYACRPLADAGAIDAALPDAAPPEAAANATESATQPNAVETGVAARDAASAVDVSTRAP